VLNVTLAELKAAPDFKYESSMLADEAVRPVGGEPAMKKTTP
jgi:hypothetical protein